MSKIVNLRERIEYYRQKKRTPSTSPVSREEFDALLEMLEDHDEEIHKTQQVLNRLVRILHRSVMDEKEGQ